MRMRRPGAFQAHSRSEKHGFLAFSAASAAADPARHLLGRFQDRRRYVVERAAMDAGHRLRHGVHRARHARASGTHIRHRPSAGRADRRRRLGLSLVQEPSAADRGNPGEIHRRRAAGQLLFLREARGLSAARELLAFGRAAGAGRQNGDDRHPPHAGNCRNVDMDERSPSSPSSRRTTGLSARISTSASIRKSPSPNM